MCGNAITLLTVLPQTTETSQLLSKFFWIILMKKGAQIPLRKEGRSLHLWRMLVQLSLFSDCIIPRHSRWVGKFADCFICCLTLRWLHRNMWHESLFLLLFGRKEQTSKVGLNPENVTISLVDLNTLHCTYSFISSIFEKLAWSRRFSKESDSWTWTSALENFRQILISCSATSPVICTLLQMLYLSGDHSWCSSIFLDSLITSIFEAV